MQAGAPGASDQEAKEATLAALYDRAAAFVFGLALRMLDDRQAAAEVVEAVFLEALEHAGDFQGRDSLAWLLHATRRHCLARLGRRPEPHFPEAHLAALIPARLGSDEERAARVRQALDSLPDAARQAVEWLYFQGLPRQEVATRLGCAQSEVAYYARLGLERLREALLSGDQGGT